MRHGRLLLAVMTATCQPSSSAAAPLGEVTLVVDTDAPVPKLVSRLRVDLYTTDGTFYQARDFWVGRPADWPASFAVALGDGDPAVDAVVRLRAYPEGYVQDGRGEVFQDRPSVCDGPSCATAPKACCPLQTAPAPSTVAIPILDGATPAPTQPQPLVTIDRLVAVHVEPGVTARLSVTLAGACLGTMSDLRDFTQLATCVDTEAQRDPVTTSALVQDTSTPGPSALVGTLDTAYAQPCSTPPRPGATAADGTPLHDDEACVPGGSFVFGGRDWFPGDDSSAIPERTALVPSFLIDRYEVTVAHYRRGIADGFSGGVPVANEGALGAGSLPESSITWCTFSTAPMGREEYPVTCVDQDTARSFCRFEGGDLPSEVQWEYAASMSGRAFKTHYAWGSGVGACVDVVYARGDTLNKSCNASGVGPASVTAVEHTGGDVTPPGASGATIVDLAGNVGEWTLEPFAARDANCWMAASLVSPACAASQAPTFAARGSSWSGTPNELVATYRESDVPVKVSTTLGFRCVRAAGAP